MDYQTAIQYLYDCAPLFQNVGGAAYKEGLTNTHLLDAHFGHPHRRYRTVHVAGTNGKGSCAHTIAAVLQAAGYRVGLYTSPHLLDFRERIRVNGEKISEQRVADFVTRERAFFEPLHPSFFEVTTALAFQHFAEQAVDVAVVEVGLGGRLDCTNIITPEISVITNISLDHTQFLGNTLAEIAAEKAGIIKRGIPVVIGERQTETTPVFEAAAAAKDAPIHWAESEEEQPLLNVRRGDDGHFRYETRLYGTFCGELAGDYQVKNTRTVLSALRHLQERGFRFSAADVAKGFSAVSSLTGLMGRWQVAGHAPLVVCDTGHNPGGWAFLSRQLNDLPCERLHIVFGVCSDKDADAILAMLPKKAAYYFTQASVRRAKPAADLRELAARYALSGSAYPDVHSAFCAAREAASSHEAIYVGGSSFVVADFLKTCPVGK